MTVAKQAVLEWYATTKHPTCEPNWHLYQEFSDEEFEFIQKAMRQENPRLYIDPIFGARVLENGCKVGTTSWVFLGRNEPTSKVYRWEKDPNWIICGRKISPAVKKLAKRHNFPDNMLTFWIAFHVNEPMGPTAMTANCFGPNESEREILMELSNAMGLQHENN